MRRDERFQVGGAVRLDVDVASGSIRVEVGEAGVVDAALDAADADIVEVTQLGDSITIRQPGRWLARGRSLRLSVRVPGGSDVTIRSASADIDLRGPLGAVAVRTASSDVRVEHAAHAHVSTASGDVRIGVCDGDSSIESASGDLTIERLAGALRTTQASGKVRVGEVGGTVEVGTTSGDVTVRCCLGDDVAVKTVSGDVHLGLPAGIRVHPDIGTLSGRTTLPAPAARARADADRPRRDVRLRLRTVSGDVRIERVDAPGPSPARG